MFPFLHFHKSNSGGLTCYRKGLKAQHTNRMTDLFPLNFSINCRFGSYESEAHFSFLFYVQSRS